MNENEILKYAVDGAREKLLAACSEMAKVTLNPLDFEVRLGRLERAIRAERELTRQLHEATAGDEELLRAAQQKKYRGDK